MNKLKIFLLFTVTLILIPGFTFVLLTGKIAQALTTSPNTVIYDETLMPEWENWSWNAVVDFNATDNPKSGAKSIAATLSGWGGLYLHTESAIASNSNEAIVFSMRSTQDTNNFAIVLYDENNRPFNPIQPITDFGENPTANSWKTYTIPLSDVNTPLKGIAIQDRSGKSSNKIYIDDLFIKKKASQDPDSSVNGTIYKDGLLSGWENWSWNSAVNMDNTSVFNSGTKSVSFAAQAPWAGLYLHARAILDTTPFTSLQFSVNMPQADQKYAIAIFDEYYNMISDPLPLERYGAVTPGKWKTYTILLNDLHATNKRISGIVIQENKGQAQPVIYIDDIAFISGSTDIPLPTQNVVIPTVAPTTMPTAVPTAKPIQKFSTLLPGSTLPSSETCAAQVRRSAWEPRPENYTANNKVGTQLTTRIDGANSAGNAKFLSRINGNFTGTTDEIIQWGACKWGLDEEIVRAVAAQESWWRQSTLGDFNGKDYESYGLLQVRRTYHEGTYPLSVESVPFNVDYALGWRRACMDGYFDWIPDSAKGDEWGCVGLWFSGRWYDGDPNVSHSGANWYIGKVKGYLETKPWLQSTF